ncbi:MAG: tRNA 2-thiouridine(34) synthase MnmA [Rhizobiales bacterium]|nr:tRNA 2-thiouridine(34) synthase MnmA [Hyphomicrobiales bacterium]NRB14113.1 tRNA 2-thiouridine(34) synthase MnmA [Hyphomicrobiales bacterium]
MSQSLVKTNIAKPLFATDGINSLGFKKPEAETRVVVAMSGGVDSSVVAAYLHEQGYEVIGITMQLYDHGQALAKKGACCAGQDIHDARRVSELLNIPHYVLDYESRFKEKVIDDFADSYLRGETPIPCVKCNQTVKFQDLLSTAEDLGADCMATGHYVKRQGDAVGARLFRAADDNRDQSYFLFATTQKQLDFIRFPLGHLPKTEVREMASRYGLIVADKPDSQDICFVPNGNYKSVIEKLRPGALTAGDIVDLQGKVLGQHQGIISYTIGQRKGLGIGGGDPLFVVRLNPDQHQVVVGPREALLAKQIYIKDINWLGEGDVESAAKQGLDVLVRLRSTAKPAPAKLKINNWSIYIEMADGEMGISSGQACVIYGGKDDRQVLGGGWIAKTDQGLALEN